MAYKTKTLTDMRRSRINHEGNIPEKLITEAQGVKNSKISTQCLVMIKKISIFVG